MCARYDVRSLRAKINYVTTLFDDNFSDFSNDIELTTLLRNRRVLFRIVTCSDQMRSSRTCSQSGRRADESVRRYSVAAFGWWGEGEGRFENVTSGGRGQWRAEEFFAGGDRSWAFPSGHREFFR